MKLSLARLSFQIFCILLIPFILSLASNYSKTSKISKTSSIIHRTKFNINNISTWIYNNGDADIKPDGNSGFEYPKGSRKAAIFESGFVWGGKVNGRILVGGSTYVQGIEPGKIKEDGTAEDPNSESVRVFRVRPDYVDGDLSSEINDGEGTDGNVRTQYQKDWNEWPANKGAPYNDIDHNGLYDPNIDVPGIPGADQTLWYVANDLDSNVAKKLYGSPTMGVELQVTVWGYKDIQVLNNMVFKKYVLINKSKNNFEDAYISLWSDPDIGNAADDFMGCDTNLNLGYAYNADNDDAIYGENVPAFGLKLLQGPLVDGMPNDTGRLNGNIFNGKKNLLMTSFPYYGKNSPEYNEPDLGEYETGTLHYYNIMQGIGSIFGTTIINPISGNEEIFALNGDPITGVGWVDGLLNPPGDRRFAVNSGPFTMSAGDTQEVIIAQIIAGADEQTDAIEAVRLLKSYNSLAQKIYDLNFNITPSTTVNLSDVNVSELDNEIILSWYDTEDLDLIEKSSFLNYNFQGYTIYQYPNRTFDNSEALVVANYDLIDRITGIDANDKFNYPEKKGKNTGIKRHISITNNLFNNERPLSNGTEYYFGVSAYLVNSDPTFLPRIIETEAFKIMVTPQSPKPGNYYEGKYGQEIELTTTKGNSNIPIEIKIVNPTKLQNKTYRLIFNINPDKPDTSLERIELTLLDNEENVLYPKSKITLQDKFGKAKPIVVDGFEIKHFEIKEYEWNPLRINDGDEFEFITPNITIGDKTLAKAQVEKVNVFPNPYYGKHGNEINQYEKFVTFNHLPRKATIRIFNLGGQLVNTIEKNDESQFVRWDLTNGRNFWVPSGIFIVYIEMPELNETKILKLAVIMETIIPDYF